MVAGDESTSQESDSTAIGSEKYFNSITEVNAIQNVSSAELASIPTFDSKNVISNARMHINEECQTLPANSPLETINIKEDGLKKTNLDKYLHFTLGISGREECSDKPFGTCKKLELLEQHSHDIKYVENEIAKEMLGNEIHSECLQEKKFLIPYDISSNQHNIRVANDTVHCTPKSLGVWKPVISKSSAGRTNKIVRTDLNIQNPGSQCIGSRITKTPYRKKSPLNWFPRKKTESFLERKIRMLQEVEGIRASLDETLFGSNIILPRVEREKRAVQAAAKEAMETRKAALVEASWCHILEAARIPCRLAAEELENAEKKASEALAKAGALGVIMKNSLSSSKHLCEGGSPSTEEGLNNTITASFETAFEVDKEVAVAVKVAFRRLSQVQHPNSNPLDSLVTDECKSNIGKEDALGVACNDELEIPEGLDGETCLHKGCFEADTEPFFEVNGKKDTSDSMKLEAAKLPLENKIFKQLPSNLEVSEDLVKLMLERIKFLSTEERKSLEQIVSTRGLGALLQEQNAIVNAKNSNCGLADMLVKHVSRLEAEKAAASKSTVLSRTSKKKTCHEDISDLGSVLVKHTSKLEKEIEEAKKSFKGEERRCCKELGPKVESLDQVLIKRISKLEKEKQEAAATAKTFEVQKPTKSIRSFTNEHSTLGLGDILKKKAPTMKDKFFKGYATKKENNDANMIGDIPSSDIKQTNISKRESKEQVESLDKILVKRLSRLEKEKAAAAAFAKAHDGQRSLESTNFAIQDHDGTNFVHTLRMNAEDNTTDYAPKYSEANVTSVVEKPGLIHSGNNPDAENISQHDLSSVAVPESGSVLIKSVSKFQQEIEAIKRASTTIHSVRRKETLHEKAEEGLDKVLVKHVSRLEREKLAASKKETSGNSSTTSTASSSVFEGQHPNQSGENQIQSNRVTENIGTSAKPDAENQGSYSEISRSSCTRGGQVKQDDGNITETSETDPFPPAMKKMSRLEIEKQQALALAASGNDPWQRRKNTRAQELQSVWGGVGLGNSLRPHVSKLEQEQAAWHKAEEEERRRQPSH